MLGQERVKDCLTETVTKGIWAIFALSLKYVDFKCSLRKTTFQDYSEDIQGENMCVSSRILEFQMKLSDIG